MDVSLYSKFTVVNASCFRENCDERTVPAWVNRLSGCLLSLHLQTLNAFVQFIAQFLPRCYQKP